MLTALALICLYLACVGFYQAAPKRTLMERVKASRRAQKCLRAISWSLIILAFVFVSLVLGVERAIPVWLCLFMLAGFGSLLASAFRPDLHIKSAYAVMAVCGVSGLIAIAGA